MDQEESVVWFILCHWVQSYIQLLEIGCKNYNWVCQMMVLTPIDVHILL